MQLNLTWPGALKGHDKFTCGSFASWPALDSIALLGASMDSTFTIQVSVLQGTYAVSGFSLSASINAAKAA